MGNKASKGGSFERQVCKLLSLWWTEGKRDDVFWRSSQSGGRATQRAKKGKTTYGSYGDVAAVDPIGDPLMKLWTIELKRGNSHGTPWDLLEGKGERKGKGARPFEKALMQAMRSAEQAGSKGWLLVLRRDRHQAMVCVDWFTMRMKALHHCLAGESRAVITLDLLNGKRARFACLPLVAFLTAVHPDQVEDCI